MLDRNEDEENKDEENVEHSSEEGLESIEDNEYEGHNHSCQKTIKGLSALDSLSEEGKRIAISSLRNKVYDTDKKIESSIMAEHPAITSVVKEDGYKYLSKEWKEVIESLKKNSRKFRRTYSRKITQSYMALDNRREDSGLILPGEIVEDETSENFDFEVKVILFMDVSLSMIDSKAIIDRILSLCNKKGIEVVFYNHDLVMVNNKEYYNKFGPKPNGGTNFKKAYETYTMSGGEIPKYIYIITDGKDPTLINFLRESNGMAKAWRLYPNSGPSVIKY